MDGRLFTGVLAMRGVRTLSHDCKRAFGAQHDAYERELARRLRIKLTGAFGMFGSALLVIFAEWAEWSTRIFNGTLALFVIANVVCLYGSIRVHAWESTAEELRPKSGA